MAFRRKYIYIITYGKKLIAAFNNEAKAKDMAAKVEMAAPKVVKTRVQKIEIQD